jgi:hypothetical protein
MKHVLINRADLFDLQYLEKISKEKSDQFEITFGFNSQKQCENAKYLKDKYAKVNVCDLKKFKIRSIKLGKEDKVLYSIYKKVLNNHSLPLILDRNQSYYRNISGLHNKYRYIQELVASDYTAFKYIRPDYIFFHTIPHFLINLIKMLVAEAMDIDILANGKYIIEERRTLIKGFKRNREFATFKFLRDTKENEQSFIKNKIETLKLNYEHAMPEYERKRINKNNGITFNLYKSLKRRNWKAPIKSFITTFNELKCWKKYKYLSIEPNGNEKFVAFFLHYQPERTSLPEGLEFSQQIFAIQTLRSVLPENVKLYVKEHPSTFTRFCSPYHRDPGFYEAINKFEGVELVNIETDTFTLVDQSIMIATLTGSVGVEALIRKKPTIYFGVPKMPYSYGAHFFKNMENLIEFVNSVCENNVNHQAIYDEIVENLYNSIYHSVYDNEYSDKANNESKKECLLRFCKNEIAFEKDY